MNDATYTDDLSFMRRHGTILELTARDGAKVAVAPAWGGRVMTSRTAACPRGFGWVNRKFIQRRQDDPTFNNYGGEDRFWLGPEAGQFGLFFSGGEKFRLDNWKAPRGLDRCGFDVLDRSRTRIDMTARFEVTNYSASRFDCKVDRSIRLLSAGELDGCIGMSLPDGVQMVGFASDNTLTNAGSEAWQRETGLLSIWTLGMFLPLPRGRVIIPFAFGDEQVLGPRAVTDYFGPIPPERCEVTEDHVLLACDGKFRCKVGVPPARVRDVLGSYDPDSGVLTVTQFTLPRCPALLPWVNSAWERQKAPYAGDVVNSYNDGGDAHGGCFYELESSSPAAELKPGESIFHSHRTLHFAGPAEQINLIARRVLNIDLTTWRKVPSTKPKIAPVVVG